MIVWDWAFTEMGLNTINDARKKMKRTEKKVLPLFAIPGIESTFNLRFSSNFLE
jgi:hypothetical protein